MPSCMRACCHCSTVARCAGVPGTCHGCCSPAEPWLLHQLHNCIRSGDVHGSAGLQNISNRVTCRCHQDSAGMVTTDWVKFHERKDNGLVSDVFNSESRMRKLPGRSHLWCHRWGADSLAAWLQHCVPPHTEPLSRHSSCHQSRHTSCQLSVEAVPGSVQRLKFRVAEVVSIGKGNLGMRESCPSLQGGRPHVEDVLS